MYQGCLETPIWSAGYDSVVACLSPQSHTQETVEMCFLNLLQGKNVTERKFKPQTHSIRQQVMWRYHFIHWFQLTESQQVKKIEEQGKGKCTLQERPQVLIVLPLVHHTHTHTHTHTHAHKQKLHEILQVRLLMLIIHFNFKQNMMIHTGLFTRLANRAKEKQMYPEMINAHEAKK